METTGESVEYVLDGGTHAGTYCFNTVDDLDPKSIHGRLQKAYLAGRLELGYRFCFWDDGYLHNYAIRNFTGYRDGFVKIVALCVGLERAEVEIRWN